MMAANRVGNETEASILPVQGLPAGRPTIFRNRRGLLAALRGLDCLAILWRGLAALTLEESGESDAGEENSSGVIPNAASAEGAHTLVYYTARHHQQQIQETITSLLIHSSCRYCIYPTCWGRLSLFIPMHVMTRLMTRLVVLRS